MARIVQGDDHIFAAMTYASQPAPGLAEYVQNEYSTAYGRLTEIGSTFVKAAERAYEELKNSDVMRVASAAMRRVASMWGTDSIRPLPELWQMQNAPNKMVRWIMAEPTIRGLYHQQRCDGYGRRYKDIEPGKVKEEHTDWRKVNSGVVQFDEEGDGWSATTYSSNYEDGIELAFEEQDIILDVWDRIRINIGLDKDPTSKWDNDLG